MEDMRQLVWELRVGTSGHCPVPFPILQDGLGLNSSGQVGAAALGQDGKSFSLNFSPLRESSPRVTRLRMASTESPR